MNDRYTQIELPEKRAAIQKLESWLAAQMEMLHAEEAVASARVPHSETTTKEGTNDDGQQSESAAKNR